MMKFDSVSMSGINLNVIAYVNIKTIILLFIQDISVSATAAEMETALNLVVSPDTVSVTMKTNSISTVYSIEFLMTKRKRKGPY